VANSINPLDTPGTIFDWAAMNPNPTASKTKLGPVYRVSFEVDQETWQMFMDSETKGMIVAGKMFRAEDGEAAHIVEPEKPGEHGKYWQGLIRAGVFNAPPVLQAIGSDAEYQEWIQKQPSCLSKESDWIEELGEGRCEYAHVRRISEGSGTGIKPDYFGVPLTHKEHHSQHQCGQEFMLDKYWAIVSTANKKIQPISWSRKDAREWFEKKAVAYRLEWASTTLVKTLGYERRRDCPPEAVKEWSSEHGLDQYFPRKAG